MNDLDLARLLLTKAENDLLILEMEEANSRFPDDAYGFHAQQAVEKALKAWIAAKGRQYPHQHDLLFLVEYLADMGENVEGADEWSNLTPFAGNLRYEVVLPEDQVLKDRGTWVKKIRNLIGTVRRITG